MKKCMFLIMAFLMLLSSCKESVPEEKTVIGPFTPFYRAPLVLNGSVKSIKVRTYWAVEKDGQIVKGDIITRTERDSLRYMNDFNLFIIEDGLPERLEWIVKDGKINHRDSEIEDNKVIGAKWYVNGEQRMYYKDEYDDSGYFIKESTYRFGVDTLLSILTSSNLENGNPDEWIYFNNKNEITGTRKFIWKKKDYISEFLSYNKEGDLNNSMKVEYDETDHWHSVVYDYPGVRLTKYDFKDHKLDEKGNLISGVSYKDDTLFNITEYIIEYYQE